MRHKWILSGDMGLGAGLIVLAIAVAIPTASLDAGFAYDRVGPRAFPYMVALLLAGSGAAILKSALTAQRKPQLGPPPVKDESIRDLRWLQIGMVSATLVFQVFFIKKLGWIPSATIAFAIVASAFGERRILLNLALGFAVACATFALFNYALGLNLPGGFIAEALFPNQD